jgi:ubiquinone/menaquinone biosynthesis C-methylase UbiE
MTDMSAVETSSMDALYSSHNIEHVYAHEVPKALAEFKRVLRPDGFVIITCPDIQAICALSVFLKITNRSSRIVCNSPRWNQSGDQLLPILRIHFEKSIFKISGKARSIKQWRSQYL